MSNQDKLTVVNYAAEARNFLARYGLTADELLGAVSTDETGRAFNPTITLGGLVDGLNEQNEQERAPRVLSHLQRALTPQPSGRWMPLISRRTAQIKRETTPLLAEAFAAVYRESARPAAWLKAFIEACDAEIKSLERQRADAQAKLRQAEKELEPLQARVNTFLRANASRRTITRLVELMTALFQMVDRGVGLTAVVLMAERLVNDRESQACAADAAAATLGILQEIRGQAQTERERISQLMARCQAVTGRIAAARTDTLARLAAHPYADVDLTDALLVERVQANIRPATAPSQLARLADMDSEQLYHEFYDATLEHVRKQTASLSLLELMDMQAADMQKQSAISQDDDLVAATLEAAYRRIANPSAELERKAMPRDWWLVGVPDETNPGFAFENATLVGAGRRDQIQFLHVQVGITASELTAVAAARDPFEQAQALRNYYVLDSLALDDHARQVFALGLAGGIIAVRDGAFAVDGQANTRLGSTVEDALDQFVQQAELVKLVEDQFNTLPLAVAAEQMKVYLERGRSTQDALWWELASYVRDRLELAQHQLTFVRNDK